MSTAELVARFGALTSDDVAALDSAAVACGVDILQLMEIAGWQVARAAWQQVGEQTADVLVLCGRGNNGGDGLVASRHLASWGCTVRSHVLSEHEHLSPLARKHAESARACGATLSFSEDPDQVLAQLHTASLLIDGILGTGLHDPPREPQASAIRAVNASGMRVLSIDVPSGMDATTGSAPGACIRATATCTLAAIKAGLWKPDGRHAAGRIVVADIGMPAAAWIRCGLTPPTDVRGGMLLPIEAPTSP